MATETVEAAELDLEVGQAAGLHEALLEAGGVGGCGAVGDAVALAFDAVGVVEEPGAIVEALAQSTAALADRADAVAGQEARGVLVDLGLELELELGDLLVVVGAEAQVEEVADALGREAARGEVAGLDAPLGVGRPERLDDRGIEVEGDVHAGFVLEDEEDLAPLDGALSDGGVHELAVADEGLDVGRGREVVDRAEEILDAREHQWRVRSSMSAGKTPSERSRSASRGDLVRFHFS